MRKFLFLLIILIPFMGACGEDSKKEDNVACSPQNPNGTCPTGKVCQNGQCKIENSNLCANVTCGSNATCNTTNGNCFCNTGFEGNPLTSCTPIQTVNGTIGSACTANGDCTDTDATCILNDALPGGYCSVTCSQDMGSCGTGGLCLQLTDGFACFKSCTLGNDSSCGRADYICDSVSQTQGICYPKCTTNSDCGDGYICKADGHCNIAPANCNVVTSEGCPSNQACYLNNGELICYQAGTAEVGQSCQYPNSCQRDLVCAGNPGVCYEICDSVNPCSTNVSCQIFTDQTFGYCPPAGTQEIGERCGGTLGGCVAGSGCLGTTADDSRCYEECTVGGAACSIQGYSCQAIQGGDTFCFPAK